MDNLVFDRTQADVTYAAELNRKFNSGEALTAQELADWNAGLKGTYNAADMNRVDAAVRELGGLLTAAGYPVEYTDPHQAEPKPPGGIEITLTSDDLQAGAYLYATGKFRAGYANYVCAKSKIKLATGKSIVVRTDLTLLQYSGFVWYDANKNFIANTYPSTSQGEAPIQWNGNFQAIPPENAVYCDININSSNITPATVGTVYVRQELSPETASLPDGYRRVEYIESSGNEYIDTGFKPDNNTRIILDVYLNAVVDDAEAAIFGARTAADSNGFYMFQDISATGNYTDGYGNTHSQDIDVSGTGRHIIDKNKNKTYIDNDLMHTYSQTTFQAPVTLCIMAVNQASGVDERFGAIKLYSCQIYDNDIIVRYYIPCTNSAGIVGLYDTVGGVFYTNAGTGSFTAGADVAPKPITDEWVVGDIINLPVWVQYIQNVQNIIEEYYTMTGSPELPEPTAPLTFDGANAIEKLLYDISKLYDAMVASYRPCGSFKCGSNTQHLPLQRSVI